MRKYLGWFFSLSFMIGLLGVVIYVNPQNMFSGKKKRIGENISFASVISKKILVFNFHVTKNWEVNSPKFEKFPIISRIIKERATSNESEGLKLGSAKVERAQYFDANLVNLQRVMYQHGPALDPELLAYRLFNNIGTGPIQRVNISLLIASQRFSPRKFKKIGLPERLGINIFLDEDEVSLQKTEMQLKAFFEYIEKKNMVEDVVVKYLLVKN